MQMKHHSGHRDYNPNRSGTQVVVEFVRVTNRFLKFSSDFKSTKDSFWKNHTSKPERIHGRETI